MIQITNKETGEVKEYTETAFASERTRLLNLWETAQKTLAAAKENEMELRKRVVDFAFDQDQKSGTENIELANGYKAKAVKKLNFSFIKNSEDKVDKKAIDSALCLIESDGAAGELIAERLVKWTPTLSLSEYKQLCGTHKAIIDAVVITKEASPTLSIVAPKSKK